MLLHLFQEDSIEAVHMGLLTSWTTGYSISVHLKAHPPFLAQSSQVSQVFLQGDVVLGCIDVLVQQAVICEESYFGLYSLRRSLMWHRKSNGPSTVPWGTPESTVASPDASPSSTIAFFFWSGSGEPFVNRSSYTIVVEFVE